MNRHALIAVAALVVGVSGAVAVRRHATRDRYVAHLEDRIDALLPAVERELGASIPGRIRVVVSTREELGEMNRREMRDLMRAIEGAPTDESQDDAAKDAQPACGVLACVDENGTIHVCRQEIEDVPMDEEPFEARLFGGIAKVRGPEVLDEILAHELVHVYQVRTLDSRAYFRRSRHRSDLLAREAVLEGHAEAVAMRVTGRAWDPGEQLPIAEKLAETYAYFEINGGAERTVFRYVQGRRFVESAIACLGRDEAIRRLFDEPPSLLQVAHPESWPGPQAPDAGTDAMLRRARVWLDTEWKETDCGPLPPGDFLRLLGPASVASADALIEVQRIEATGAVLWNAVNGHLLAAGDEAGARVLYDAWVEAARARDALIPQDPKLRGMRVLASEWTDAEIDGRSAASAVRRYKAADSSDERLEHAVVVRRGRYVLELRLIDDPGGGRAVLRLARRFLACVVDAPEKSDPESPEWDARWRFAADPRSAVERLRALLGDPDADVRHAALSNLLRRGALAADERGRARHDIDPLVRLTALTWCPAKAKPNEDDLLVAVRDADPWVAAGGFLAARAHYMLLTDDAIAAALRRPQITVRRAASGLVRDRGRSGDDDKGTLALVRIALADEDAGVRRYGAAPLLHIATKTAGLSETFVRLLTGADEDLRRQAVMQLCSRSECVPGTAAAVTPLLENEELRDFAIEALGKLGAEALPAVPSLRRIAEEAERARDTSLRLHALAVVCRIAGDRSELVDVLRSVLATGSDEEVRAAVDVLYDQRDVAADFVPEMAKRLGSRDRHVVLTILDVLENLGRGAAPARSAVEPLCRSEDPVVRKRALKTRERIR